MPDRLTLGVLDALGTCVALLRQDGKICWVNAALTEASGSRRWQAQALDDLLAQPLIKELLTHALAAQAPTLARGLDCCVDGSRSSAWDVRVSLLGDAAPALLLAELSPAKSDLPAVGSGFGRMIAHEVRNPLGAIRGAAQLLARDCQLEGQVELAQLIVEETTRIDALVAQLHGGPSRSEPQLINVHRITEHVCQLAQAEFGKALRVGRDYDPSLPDLILDHPRLVQALLNLLRNAAQAGATQVTMRTRADHHYRIGGQFHRLVLRLEVDDDGPGIPHSLREQILQAGVSGRSDGSGLGLAVVDAVAREHAGELSFDSQPGHTSFSLRLPWRL